MATSWSLASVVFAEKILDASGKQKPDVEFPKAFWQAFVERMPEEWHRRDLMKHHGSKTGMDKITKWVDGTWQVQLGQSWWL